MTERPILFSGPMVRAVLDDSKTQTRRIVKPQPIGRPWFWEGDSVDPEPQWFDGYERGRAPCGAGIEDINKPIRCPYGQPGDRLWVRETWDWRDWSWNKDCRVRIAYAADGEQADKTSPVGWRPTIYNYERWRPSIHMPRWASRITLEVLGVRVERLQDISEEDAWAEGVLACDGLIDETDIVRAAKLCGLAFFPARATFFALFANIYGWELLSLNPWVWVVEFKRAGSAVIGDATRDRWVTISRDWDLMVLRDPVLHALISQWVKDEALTLRWVADEFVRRTRERIEKLAAEGAPVAHLGKWLPTWRSEAPNIQDSPEHEREEARRVCACACGVMNIAIDVARRHRETSHAPHVILKGPNP